MSTFLWKIVSVFFLLLMGLLTGCATSQYVADTSAVSPRESTRVLISEPQSSVETGLLPSPPEPPKPTPSTAASATLPASLTRTLTRAEGLAVEAARLRSPMEIAETARSTVTDTASKLLIAELPTEPDGVLPPEAATGRKLAGRNTGLNPDVLRLALQMIAVVFWIMVTILVVCVFLCIIFKMKRQNHNKPCPVAPYIKWPFLVVMLMVISGLISVGLLDGATLKLLWDMATQGWDKISSPF